MARTWNGEKLLMELKRKFRGLMDISWWCRRSQRFFKIRNKILSLPEHNHIKLSKILIRSSYFSQTNFHQSNSCKSLSSFNFRRLWIKHISFSLHYKSNFLYSFISQDNCLDNYRSPFHNSHIHRATTGTKASIPSCSCLQHAERHKTERKIYLAFNEIT